MASALRPHVPRRPFRRLSPDLLAGLPLAATLLLAAACGGGGGGGPTAPPSMPPLAQAVAVEGSVVGMFDAGTSFRGTTVTLSGAGSADVDGANEFRIDAVTPGVYTATFAGDNHLKRRLRVEVVAGGTNRFDGLDLVEKASFNLAAFDDIYRDPHYFGDGTDRWLTQPFFDVDRESFDDALGADGDDRFNEVVDFVRNRIEVLTEGLMSKQKLRFVDVLEPTSTLVCDTNIPDGTVPIQAVDEIASDDTGVFILGTCGGCVLTGSEITKAHLTLSSLAVAATVLHEFGHVLGATHLDSASGASLMTPFFDPTVLDFTAMDLRHLKYLYSRPPDSKTPDDTSHLAPMKGVVGASSSTSLASQGGLQAESPRHNTAEGEVGVPVDPPPHRTRPARPPR